MKVFFIAAFFMLFLSTCFAQQIDSVKIVYCYKTIESPATVLPQWFEDGAFLKHRDSLVIKDYIFSNRLHVDLNNLQRYKKNRGIDTRGKITLYFSNQTKQVWYYDCFCLQQKDDPICYKWTKKMKLFLNSIANINKKPPIFQKDDMNIKYADDANDMGC